MAWRSEGPEFKSRGRMMMMIGTSNTPNRPARVALRRARRLHHEQSDTVAIIRYGRPCSSANWTTRSTRASPFGTNGHTGPPASSSSFSSSSRSSSSSRPPAPATRQLSLRLASPPPWQAWKKMKYQNRKRRRARIDHPAAELDRDETWGSRKRASTSLSPSSLVIDHVPCRRRGAAASLYAIS